MYLPLTQTGEEQGKGNSTFYDPWSANILESWTVQQGNNISNLEITACLKGQFLPNENKTWNSHVNFMWTCELHMSYAIFVDYNFHKYHFIYHLKVEKYHNYVIFIDFTLIDSGR